MNDQPLVSSIIIFLNEDRFIEEAIASVFAQTYTHWELLLVDDGSMDNSSKIARTYAQTHSDKVHYLDHPGHQNLGMSSSRNLGLAHTQGEYIAFLDADDIWLPKKLEEQLDIFIQHPEVGMVYGKSLIWHSWAEHIDNQRQDYFVSLGVEANTIAKPPDLFVKLLQTNVQTPTTCNAIIRKSLIADIGGFDDKFRGLYEDRVFFSKLLLQTPVFVSDRDWAKYRQHSDSSFNAATLPELDASKLTYYAWLELYLIEQRMMNPEITMLLNKNQSSPRMRQRHPILYYYWTLGLSQLRENFIEELMHIGRLILPFRLRNWLWKNLIMHK